MTRAWVIAAGAVSARGAGELAYRVGEPGAAAVPAFSPRNLAPAADDGRLFGRAGSCRAQSFERPEALLGAAWAELSTKLDEAIPNWREHRVAAVVGTASGGLAAFERFLQLREMEPSPASWHERAELAQRSTYSAALSLFERSLGRRPQPLVSLFAACASSTLAIGLGTRWLEHGHADLVIAGGYDAESVLVNAGFDALRATARSLPRPFRAERDGMVLGEGAALVALSRAPRAGRRAFAFIRGFAATTDAVHITAPDRDGRGLVRAAQSALAEAGLEPAEIDIVSVHGTGTSFNDASEAQALLAVFGERARDLPLQPLKSELGHSLGAAGVLETLAAASALARGVLPAAASSGAPMPEFAARLLARNEAAAPRACLKVSTAFGGANAALVLSQSDSPSQAPVSRAVHLAALGTPVFELDPARLGELARAPSSRLPRSDTLSELVVAACAEPLRSLESSRPGFERLRAGVVVGSFVATLEASADFAARCLAKNSALAEPRRFPATSPNVCAGHAAIVFGLGGPSHAVGSSPNSALEALLVAHDWIESGDADFMFVVAAEHLGPASREILALLGEPAPEAGALALVLTAAPLGPVVPRGRLEQSLASGQRMLAPTARSRTESSGSGRSSAFPPGFQGLGAIASELLLLGSQGFGSVRPLE